MRERPNNQAAGLLDLAAMPSPKLTAMVAHGDEQAELPLLLRMCAAWVGFGYPVTVLDGTVRESADNPGLDHKYTVFGEVIEGMEVADKIVSAKRDRRDNPDVKIEMKIEKI